MNFLQTWLWLIAVILFVFAVLLIYFSEAQNIVQVLASALIFFGVMLFFVWVGMGKPEKKKGDLNE